MTDSRRSQAAHNITPAEAAAVAVVVRAQIEGRALHIRSAGPLYAAQVAMDSKPGYKRKGTRR